MPLGKGGSSGSQSGTSNTQTAGNSSTAGVNGSYSSGVAMPIAPGGYEDAWRSMLAGGGQTPGQSSAMNFFSNGGANSLLNPERNGWYGANDRNANIAPLTTVGGFNQAYGGPPKALDPNQVGTSQVQAAPAASFMQPYQQGYTNDVVNATTNDLFNQYGRAQNASNMAGTAAGGFNNARMGLRDAQVQDDFLRNLATTSGTLRDQGFSRGMQGGQFDAGQAYGASGQNAANSLTASGQNVANKMGNDQFNAQLQQQRDQFAANNVLAANQAQMGNTATAAGIGTNAANSAAGIGGQQFTQGLGALNAGNPLFGQANQSSNKGGNVGANDMAGNSDTQSSGKNSSKGGGLSIGGG